MFDNSIRVPLLVRWPGTVAPGTTIDRVVSNLDLFPTILEMTGSGVPDNLKLSGRSFVPLLREPGSTSNAWDDTLFGQYDMHNGQVARMEADPDPGVEAHPSLRAGSRGRILPPRRRPGGIQESGRLRRPPRPPGRPGEEAQSVDDLDRRPAGEARLRPGGMVSLSDRMGIGTVHRPSDLAVAPGVGGSGGNGSAADKKLCRGLHL